ncbi:MAG TPA: hypothetical protein VJM33_17390 [Microthrixaceae bacterium]|nr:hypothetical protein [Microthrixaceae bacterium]
MFSDEQRAFADAVGGGAGVDLDSLRPLGPVHALRWEESMNDSLELELGAEQWIADDLLFLELSIRAKFNKAEQLQRRFGEWAADEELGVAASATTKTQAILEHFAGRLER